MTEAKEVQPKTKKQKLNLTLGEWTFGKVKFTATEGCVSVQYNENKPAKTYTKFDVASVFVSIMKIELESDYLTPHKDNIRFTKHYGVSPGAVKKIFHQLMNCAFLDNLDKELVKKLCVDRYGNGKFSLNPSKVNSLIQNYELVQQCKKDGILNITPFVLRYSMTPKELKEYFGSELWKSLCKNTLYRNKLVCPSKHDIATPDSVKLRNKVASSVYKNLNPIGYYLDFAQWYTKYCKGKYGNKREITSWLHLFQVTDKTVNVQNWSPRRLKEEHARKYSKGKFNWLSSTTLPLELEHKNFKAKLLESKFEVAQEGTEMQHCVAGYAPRCEAGNYAVYSITKDGEKYSTLGLSKYSTQIRSFAGGRIISERYYCVDQHYMKQNKVVQDEEAKELADKIIELANPKVENVKD